MVDRASFLSRHRRGRRDALRKLAYATSAALLPVSSLGVNGVDVDASASDVAQSIESVDIASMIGQMLILGLPGKSVNDTSAQLLGEQIAAGKVGGSVLLRHNVRSRAEVLGLTQLFIEANPKVLNAVDQEGGLVQRLAQSVGFFRVPRAQWVATHLTLAQAQELYFEAGEELRNAGFNLNLAPSIDWHDPDNPVIGKFGRSFGADEATIAQYASRFVAGMRKAGMASTLKHFPGHGTSRGDSHNGFVDISGSWSAEELQPFATLAPMSELVMGGHLFHPKFSSDGLPITFSRQALQAVLRDSLAFRGVIITDDLDMGAIRSAYSLEDAVIRALQAGNDLLLMSNSLRYDPELPDRVGEWVQQGIADGRLNLGELQASYRRVMALKNTFAFEPSFAKAFSASRANSSTAGRI